MMGWLFNRKPWHEPEFLLAQINQLKKDVFMLSFKCPCNLGDDVEIYQKDKLITDGTVNYIKVENMNTDATPVFYWDIRLLNNNTQIHLYTFSDLKVRVIKKFVIPSNPFK